MMGRYPNCTMSCYRHGLSQGTRDHRKEVARHDPPHTHTHAHTHTHLVTVQLRDDNGILGHNALDINQNIVNQVGVKKQ